MLCVGPLKGNKNSQCRMEMSWVLLPTAAPTPAFEIFIPEIFCNRPQADKQNNKRINGFGRESRERNIEICLKNLGLQLLQNPVNEQVREKSPISSHPPIS